LDGDGTLAIVADDFQGTAIAAPTNLVFAGADRKTIYLASLGRWHIAAMETDVAGVALRYPRNSYEGNA
jgi:gluconolactonase